MGTDVQTLVIGAGLSGLTVAGRLARGGGAGGGAGGGVVVIDKGRGVGGRLATRRVGELRFDHGAQFFTVRDGRFAAKVEAWKKAGVVAAWEARFAHVTAGVVAAHPSEHVRYVAVPGMSALCKHVASGLDVRCGMRATGIAPATGGGWSVTAVVEDGSHKTEMFTAEHVVVAVPEVQARALLGSQLPIGATTTDPCWAVMVNFPVSLGAPFDAAWIQGSPLAFVAREGSKPGRTSDPAGGEAWILHASASWSRQQLELTPEEVAPRLLDALGGVLQVAMPTPTFIQGHRWRYAQTSSAVGTAFAATGDGSLSACGDYFLGGKIEAAFFSGVELAENLVVSGKR